MLPLSQKFLSFSLGLEWLLWEQGQAEMGVYVFFGAS